MAEIKRIDQFRWKLFIVWNRARAKARQQPDSVEQILDRLNKALGILQSRDYYQAEKELYHPDFYSCGCKDWEFRLAANRKYVGPCKHIAAEILKYRVNHLTYEQTTFLGLLEAAQELKIEWPGKVWVKGLPS